MLPLLALLSLVSPSATGEPDPFLHYMRTDFPPADGFDFPVGDKNGRGAYRDLRTGKQHRGWYIATRFAESYALGLHTGEDWNGRGGGDTDLGQPVRAIGEGKVVYASVEGAPWGGVVMIDHIYYENHHQRRIRSQYAHLSKIDVAVGDLVKRRQRIGAIGRDPAGSFPAHLHLELRTDRTLPATYWPSSHDKPKPWLKEHYTAPSAFIKSHRKLLVPQREPVLLLVDEATHSLARYEHGRRTHFYEIGFGQAAGRKRVQGDLKTPKGMYFVVHKYRGKFTGAYGDYYGGHWIKVNYPNAFDAQWGEEAQKISSRTARKIAKDWRKRRLTNQKTRLGGGIGFHGWAGPWQIEDGGRLSWGCVVMHNPDIKALFDHIPKGAMVVMF